MPAKPGVAGMAALYLQPRLIIVLLMGFSSGLPLLLSGVTLKIWLSEAHLSFTQIGLFGLAGLSYTFKFCWAPLFDRLRVPVLGELFGRRRSWLMVIQPALMAALFGLGSSDPVGDLVATACWAVAVGFLSASQDIVIDAYRIELLAPAEQGAGAAVTQIGYRLGVIAAGAGALYLAAWLGWQASYAVMAALLPIGGIAAFFHPEPAPVARPAGTWFETGVLAPFTDFVTRHENWLVLLLFVPLYRFGDAVAGEMAPSFYIALGFSKIEYANVSKIFGIIASLAGVSVGGLLVYRLGVMRVLLLGAVLQIFANLTYVGQLWAGHDVAALYLTIGIEQGTIGLCGAAFVAFLSGLCSPAYTATQYALLSALFGFAYRFLGSAGGYFVDLFGWAWFFCLSAGLVLPSFVLLLWLMYGPSGVRDKAA
jgi:PAT family beta-lactamase induction signal transducer AmpG